MYTSSYNLYTCGCNVFTCKSILNTRSFDFYICRCDVFTWKNAPYTRWYNLYTCGCNVFTYKNALYTLSYKFYTCGCNVLRCRNVLYTLWYELYTLRAPIFTIIAEVWPRAKGSMVTNNLTVIIEEVLKQGHWPLLLVCALIVLSFADLHDIRLYLLSDVSYLILAKYAI